VRGKGKVAEIGRRK